MEEIKILNIMIFLVRSKTREKIMKDYVVCRAKTDFEDYEKMKKNIRGLSNIT
jgi:hypothetical protein